MRNSKIQPTKQIKKSNNKKVLTIAVGSFILIVAIIIIAINFGGGNKEPISPVANNGNTANPASTANPANTATNPNLTEDLKINISEISETAKFYPFKVVDTDMEVFAVKASDGTIRTAFNTCQVCYDSGRGYYVQEGKELVCQNCGNRFQLDQIELTNGVGCNPVPITGDNKTDDGKSITISGEYLQENVDLFANWDKN